MLEITIKGLIVIWIINMILKHNLFISTLKVKVKFLGLDIVVNSKEKKHPSRKLVLSPLI